MANETVMNRGKYRIAKDGWANLDLRVGLIGNSGGSLPAGAYATTLDTVSDLLAVSGVTECNATNYTRKALASETNTEDDGNNRTDLELGTAITWIALGGAANDTLRALFFYAEAGSSATDATRDLICVIPITALPTNGGDVTLPTGDVIRAS